MAQKLLIIDDSPPIHALVRARLAEERLDIRGAFRAAEGCAIAAEFKPDLVLLDLGLPDASGIDVCRRLNASPELINVPILLMVDANASLEKARGLDAGAVDFVVKPFDPTELRARVRAALRLKYLVDLLADKAQVDGLTGLWDRKHFDERLASETALASRTGRPLSILRLEIDNFPTLADRHGRPFADEVIKQVARALADSMRREDLICHCGETFAVVAPNTSAASLHVAAERLRQTIASLALVFRGQPVPLTLSLGVADLRDGMTPHELVDAADGALDTAKKLGRNRTVVAQFLKAAM